RAAWQRHYKEVWIHLGKNCLEFTTTSRIYRTGLPRGERSRGGHTANRRRSSTAASWHWTGGRPGGTRTPDILGCDSRGRRRDILKLGVQSLSRMDVVLHFLKQHRRSAVLTLVAGALLLPSEILAQSSEHLAALARNATSAVHGKQKNVGLQAALRCGSAR